MYYICEYCDEEFETFEECEKHESECKPYYVSLKKLTCAFDFYTGTFSHYKKEGRFKENIIRKCWISTFTDEYVERLEQIKDESVCNSHTIHLVCYTKDDSEQHENEIFNQMHNKLKEKGEEIKKNIEKLDSKEFQEYKFNFIKMH